MRSDRCASDQSEEPPIHGDQEGFYDLLTLVVEKHLDSLIAFIAARLPEWVAQDVRDDIVQEVLLLVWNRHKEKPTEGWESFDHLVGWLFKAAIYELLKATEFRQKYRGSIDGADKGKLISHNLEAAQQNAQREADHRRFYELVEKLTPDEKKFYLSYVHFDGDKLAIGDAFQLSVGAVQKRFERLNKKLYLLAQE